MTTSPSGCVFLSLSFLHFPPVSIDHHPSLSSHRPAILLVSFCIEFAFVSHNASTSTTTVNNNNTAALLVASTCQIPFLAILAFSYCCVRRDQCHLPVCTFLSTIGVSETCTRLVKYWVQRFRPNFFSLCRYNGTGSTVGDGCTNDFSKVLEGQLSFPSGHSSLSFCSMTVLVWLLYSRRYRVVCWTPWIFSAIVGISRIVNQWHHPLTFHVPHCLCFSMGHHKLIIHPLGSLAASVVTHPPLSHLQYTRAKSQSKNYTKPSSIYSFFKKAKATSLSSTNSLAEISIFCRENALISNPSTIVYLWFASIVRGNEYTISSGMP